MSIKGGNYIKYFKYCVRYLQDKGFDLNVISNQRIIEFTYGDTDYKFLPTQNKWQSRSFNAYKGKWPWRRVNGKIYAKWYSAKNVKDFVDSYVNKSKPK